MEEDKDGKTPRKRKAGDPQGGSGAADTRKKEKRDEDPAQVQGGDERPEDEGGRPADASAPSGDAPRGADGDSSGWAHVLSAPLGFAQAGCKIMDLACMLIFPLDSVLIAILSHRLSHFPYHGTQLTSEPRDNCPLDPP